MNQFIEKFQQGTKYVNVVSAITSQDLTQSDRISDDYLEKKCIKFIPASGAATRMFKDLYRCVDENESNDSVKHFIDHIEGFAFYDDLKKVVSDKLNLGLLQDQIKLISILLEEGLSYGSLPKGLLKFHKYDNEIVTPIDEHIFEGEHYIKQDSIKLHFTISKEHESLFNAYVKGAIKDKPSIEITYSFQKKETDTLAVDMDNQPFKLEDGSVLYRAGGHGSLIENLNDIDADIIFIKNIDNVCHRDMVSETINTKKMLASIGNTIKDQVDVYVKRLLEDTYDISEIETFIKETLKIRLKDVLTKEFALKLLNRPLRVCGVVKNQGEPGGGPFVVDNGSHKDFQICETVELDPNNKEQMSILSASAFFNPVDLVCFVKDYQGQKFDLRDFINEDRYFISEKTFKGRKLKALEHPGLWNGAMHNWNTIFVEVPLNTFNPVKTVNDLLRQGHQAL